MAKLKNPNYKEDLKKLREKLLRKSARKERRKAELEEYEDTQYGPNYCATYKTKLFHEE